MRILACAGLATMQSYAAHSIMVRALERIPNADIHVLASEAYCREIRERGWSVDEVSCSKRDQYSVASICDIVMQREFDVLFTVADIWALGWVPPVLERVRRKRSVAWFPWFFLDQPWQERWGEVLQPATVALAASRFALRAVEDIVTAVLAVPTLDSAVWQVPNERRHELRLKNYGETNPFVVGFVGNAQFRKCLPRALKAFGRFTQERSNSILVLHTQLESGPLGDVRYLCDDYGIPRERVLETGQEFLSPKQMNDLLNGFDALLCSSLGEGIGLPLLEAQLAGVPVIAPHNSAITELLDDGRGVLVDMAGPEAVETLPLLDMRRQPEDGSLSIIHRSVDLEGVSVEGLYEGLLALCDNPSLRESIGVAGKQSALEYQRRAVEFDWPGLFAQGALDVAASTVGVVAVFSVEREQEYLDAAMRSVYPHVDSLVVLFGAWQGAAAERDCSRDIVRHFYDPDGKVSIEDRDAWEITGADGGQLAKRTEGFRYCEDGDWYWLIDGDEVYDDESASQIVSFLRSRESQDAEAYAVYSYNFWKGFDRYAWGEWYARIFRSRSGRHFTRANEVSEDSGKRLSVVALPLADADGLPSVYKCHFGYAKRPEETVRKIAGYIERHKRGDFPPIAERWLKDVYAPAKPPEGAWLHPIEGYSGAREDATVLKPFERNFPHVLVRHQYSHYGAVGFSRPRDEHDPMWSIAIVTFETSLEMLSALAKSLGQTDLGHGDELCEIVLVDNGSERQYRHGEVAKDELKALFPWAERVGWAQNEENLLYTAATNQAMGLFAGQYLVLVNPDIEVVPQPKFFRSLREQMEAAGTGIAAPVQLHQDRSVHFIGGAIDAKQGASYAHGGDLPFRPWHVGRNEPLPQLPHNPYLTDWATGSFLVIPRETILNLGVMNEWRFPHYASDVEYTMRANRCGYPVHVMPNHQAIHKVGRSSVGYENVFSRE